MEYVMGIDLGTSSVKAILMDRQGRTAAVAQKEYKVETPETGYAQQRPQKWWQQTKLAIWEVMERGKVMACQVKGIGFSGQMHGLVILDKEKNVLMPAVIWMDQRTRQEQEKILQIVKEERLESQLMNRPMAGMMICSLLWVKEHRPEIYEKAAYVMLPKDYVRFCLGGTIETDETDAGGSIAFSVRDRQWCTRLLKRLEISEALFPPVAKPYEIVGAVTKKAEEETGLLKGTLLVAGGADSAMQLTGNGVASEGTLCVNIGTASQILTVMSKPCYDEKLRTQTLCHSAPDLWYGQCGSLNGGNTLSWLRNNVLKTTDNYQKLDKEAGMVLAGSEGLFFLPYLAGERVPYENPDARGMFFGLSMRHERAHIVRSVMEGVALNLRMCLDVFKEAGIQADWQSILASGGGAKGQTWRQIQADVFGLPVYETEGEEEACAGAAMMASVGLGWYSSVEQAAKAIVKRKPEPTEPVWEHRTVYEETLARFRFLTRTCQNS